MKLPFPSQWAKTGRPLRRLFYPPLARNHSPQNLLSYQEKSRTRLEIMHVLIIDDEPLAHTALANILARRRDVERFDSANDAVEALDKLSKETYDVILLDINMPEISGMELLDRMKTHARPVPSVVFVTAHQEHAITAFR